MQHVDGNLSAEIGRKELHDWQGTMWSRRYQSIVVSGEEAAQVARLRYHLAHSVKEGLVDRVKRWPGVHFAKSILGGKPLKGLWFDRTAEFAARNRGENFGRLKYAEEEELVLSQLPCWADLTPEQYRARIAELVEETRGTCLREATKIAGRRPLGVEAPARSESLSTHLEPLRTRPEWLRMRSAPLGTGSESLRMRSERFRTRSSSLRTGFGGFLARLELLEMHSEWLRMPSEPFRICLEPLRMRPGSLRTRLAWFRMRLERLWMRSESFRTRSEPFQMRPESFRMRSEPLRMRSERLWIDPEPSGKDPEWLSMRSGSRRARCGRFRARKELPGFSLSPRTRPPPRRGVRSAWACSGSRPSRTPGSARGPLPWSRR
jgi:hypothetical protein